jgi:hypothetical protein
MTAGDDYRAPDDEMERRLTHPFPSRQWNIPCGIQVRDDRLIAVSLERRPVRANAGLLEGFIGLAEKPENERFESYANRWGLLGRGFASMAFRPAIATHVTGQQSSPVPEGFAMTMTTVSP